MIEDDIRTVMTFRNLRTPRKRASYLCGFTGKGSLAITDQRILGYVRHNERQVHVPFDEVRDPQTSGIRFSINEKGFFCVNADLSKVHRHDATTTTDESDIRGTMELVYQTSQASTILNRLPRSFQ